MATSTAYTRLMKGRCGKNAKGLAAKFKANGLKNGKAAKDLDATIKRVLSMSCNLAGLKKKAATPKKKTTRSRA